MIDDPDTAGWLRDRRLSPAARGILAAFAAHGLIVGDAVTAPALRDMFPPGTDFLSPIGELLHFGALGWTADAGIRLASHLGQS